MSTLEKTICSINFYIYCRYIVHPTSAENIPFWLQDALCFFAVSNSLVNPIVYGFFARKRSALSLLPAANANHNGRNDVLSFRANNKRYYRQVRPGLYQMGVVGAVMMELDFRDVRRNENQCGKVLFKWARGTSHALFRRPLIWVEKLNESRLREGILSEELPLRRTGRPIGHFRNGCRSCPLDECDYDPMAIQQRNSTANRVHAATQQPRDLVPHSMLNVSSIISICGHSSYVGNAIYWLKKTALHGLSSPNPNFSEFAIFGK